MSFAAELDRSAARDERWGRRCGGLSPQLLTEGGRKDRELTTEPDSVTTIEKILVPTDGSLASFGAARYAAKLAKAFEAEVTLLHVVEVPRIPDQLLIEKRDSELRREFIEAGKAILALTQKTLSDLGVPANTELLEGRPGDAIVLAAVQGKYDLIVMGSRGLGPSESALLGSVSDHVAHYARCPVLIVRRGTANVPE